VVVLEDGVRHITAHRWGLVPPSASAAASAAARATRPAAPLINARAETISTNALFRAAFERRRCLVPVDGFYEWRHLADGRQPYFIRASDDEPLTLAGIWLPWRSAPNGLIGSCSIVTTTPDAVVGRLHDRMPVILSRSAWDSWLSPETSAAEALGLLEPASPVATLRAFPVVRLVNDVRNDGPQLLAPAPEQPTLF
jgi:putative SOS response-associated peptidase YedK